MKGKSKRLYNKPKISKVMLLPEEAVLVNCKVGGSGSGTKKCYKSPAESCASREYGS